MTGRRLYDKFCDAAYRHNGTYFSTALPGGEREDPVAWPFLSPRDQSVWNTLARTLTPSKRKART